jgi:hypothetical protein
MQRVRKATAPRASVPPHPAFCAGGVETRQRLSARPFVRTSRNRNATAGFKCQRTIGQSDRIKVIKPILVAAFALFGEVLKPRMEAPGLSSCWFCGLVGITNAGHAGTDFHVQQKVRKNDRAVRWSAEPSAGEHVGIA